MRFHHSPVIWEAHPTLVVGVISAAGITADVDVQALIRPHWDTALARLEERSVGEFPEVQAWRRVFASMGLKPTQYRCASESLLRRLHKEARLPQIHPLIDLCNHHSVSSAIPIAVFDTRHIVGDLAVRPADGTERYESFSGDTEHPSNGEIIFADDVGQAHARRWTNRQAATSAIGDATSDVLIVIEALHEGARQDVETVMTTLSHELTAIWRCAPHSELLDATHPSLTTEAH